MLALEVVLLPVTDIDRRSRATLNGSASPSTLITDPPPTSELYTSRRPDRRVLYNSRLLAHLAECTTGISLRPISRTLATLIASGVPVGEIRHKDPVETWAGGWSAGLDLKRRGYASFADFADPDGNTWTLQERGHHAS